MNKIGSFLKSLKENPGFISVVSSLISILIGVFLGFILLLVLKPESALNGITNMLLTGVSSLEKIGKVFYTAMPIMLTGLSVAFAFKTGLFNIGAAGQYVVGGFFAIYAGIMWNFPWWAALIVAMFVGAIWGLVPGIFKALLNVNEVITSIMLNWIGLYFVNVVMSNTKYMQDTPERTARLALKNPSAVLPKLGLDKLFNSNLVSIGVIIAILFAVIIYIILNKTTFGYELKACGHNKNASKYAGINDNRNIILSMVIAGALAGLGGGLYYLNGGAQFTLGKTLPGAGFNGIPVALLASSNPIGVIFAALFVSYIQVGGEAMQPEYAPEAITIIISIILYLSAFSLLFKNIIAKYLKKRKTNKEEEKV